MKSSLAEQLDDAPVVQEIGTVESDGGRLVVESRSGRLEASRAVSCLVEPEAGDTVLVAVAPSGLAWVLAVLDRAEPESPTTLAVDGDLRVHVSNGRFQVRADGLDLVSRSDATVATRRLDVHAVEGAVFFDKLTYIGRLVHADVETVKTFVRLFDQVLDRFSQRVKRSYRFVEELDMTRAKQIEMHAEDNVNVRGHNTMMSAELLVKIDGKQIHLG